MSNPFVHVELQTSDLTKAKAFYSELFDWKLEEIPAPGGEMPYTTVNVSEGAGAGGGMFANPDPQPTSHWLAYVAVDDVDTFALKAHNLGATVLQDVMGVGGQSWLSVIRDPTGAVIGLWKPKQGL